MASPKASGRMLRKSVSESEKIASLSTEAAVLFFMLIPHFNGHGKMAGGPGAVKDEIVPFLEYFTYENLPTYLQEISDKTNVKWFISGKRWWLHSLNFLSKHQELREDKLGSDDLPSYTEEQSEVSSELVGDKSGTGTGLPLDLPSRGSLKLEERRKKKEEDLKGGGVVDTAREDEKKPPPLDPEGESGFESGVAQVKDLHLQTCGLGSMPPVAVVREILRQGIVLQKVLDVYQTFGGDPMRYRQRNITERLIDLREGRERSPPKKKRGKAADRQDQALKTAERLLAEGPPGGSI